MDAVLWAISPDEPERLASFRDKEGIGFPLLLDADSETIAAWGILNEKQGAVPHPTVAVVDRQGVVRFFHLDEDYRRRPAPAVIIEALKELGE
jgi:peroxiredoxin